MESTIGTMRATLLLFFIVGRGISACISHDDTRAPKTTKNPALDGIKFGTPCKTKVLTAFLPPSVHDDVYRTSVCTRGNHRVAKGIGVILGGNRFRCRQFRSLPSVLSDGDGLDNVQAKDDSCQSYLRFSSVGR